MNEIVVLCPTRGRPNKAAEMVQSFRETTHLFSTEMILVVDDDDACLDDYRALPDQFNGVYVGRLAPPNPIKVMVIPADEGGSLTAATNTAARRIWDDDCIIGHVGDDHRFQSQGWDKMVTEALSGRIGVVYGNDGYWGQELPTAAFLSSAIPRALGWYALPLSRHYGIDNAWGDIGKALDSLWYIPEMKIVQPGPGETAAAGDDIFWKAQEHRAEDANAYFVWRDQGAMKEELGRLVEKLR